MGYQGTRGPSESWGDCPCVFSTTVIFVNRLVHLLLERASSTRKRIGIIPWDDHVSQRAPLQSSEWGSVIGFVLFCMLCFLLFSLVICSVCFPPPFVLCALIVSFSTSSSPRSLILHKSPALLVVFAPRALPSLCFVVVLHADCSFICLSVDLLVREKGFTAQVLFCLDSLLICSLVRRRR